MRNNKHFCHLTIESRTYQGVSPILFPDDFTFILDGREVKCNNVIADIVSPAVASIHRRDESVKEFSVDYQDNDGDMEFLISGVKNGFIDVPFDKIDDFVSLCLELDNFDIAKRLQKYKRSQKNGENFETNKVQKIPEGNMQIFIKTANGKFIMLLVDPNERIETLKLRIQEKEGTSVDRQKLIFAGRQLEDGNTLQDYEIKKEDVIHFFIYIRGTISIK